LERDPALKRQAIGWGVPEGTVQDGVGGRRARRDD